MSIICIYIYIYIYASSCILFYLHPVPCFGEWLCRWCRTGVFSLRSVARRRCLRQHLEGGGGQKCPDRLLKQQNTRWSSLDGHDTNEQPRANEGIEMTLPVVGTVLCREFKDLCPRSNVAIASSLHLNT